MRGHGRVAAIMGNLSCWSAVWGIARPTSRCLLPRSALVFGPGTELTSEFVQGDRNEE
jgi:hypothetical protein